LYLFVHSLVGSPSMEKALGMRKAWLEKNQGMIQPPADV
jgi:hypothetical protein